MRRPPPMTTTTRPRRRLVRRSALILLAIVIVLAAALPIIWMQLAANARVMARTFLAREAARGRQWTCIGPSELSGFPFTLAYDCDDARFDGVVGGRPVKASVKGLHASVFLPWPAHPSARLDGPMRIEESDGDTVAVAWKTFSVGARLVPFAIDRIDGVIDRLTADLTQPSQQTRLLDADHLAVQARPVPASAAGGRMVEIAAALSNAVSPLLEQAVPSQGGVEAHAVATIDQLDALERGSLADRLEAWRLAGGRLTLLDVHGAKGASIIDAKGDLGLDITHMPDGTIDTSVAGIEPFLKRMGIPTGVAAFGSLLSGFMGGGKSSVASHPGALSLKVRLSEGRVYAGPIRLHTSLRPLY